MHKCILHVDMDAFYASVEIRDRPELKGRPVVVGGSPHGRGVVAAASYEARRFGVHSALPASIARRRCPEAVFIQPRHDYYAQVSRHIRQILECYTPLIEPLALDEAFLDVTASRRLWGDGASIARHIKAQIRNQVGVVASLGVAPNKFLAKLASDLEKPDGLVVIEPATVHSLLDPLPVSRLWGVGETGQRALVKLGVHTIGELRTVAPDTLRNLFGAWGTQLLRLAHGVDERPVVSDRAAKSISHETTFAEDIADVDALRSVMLELTEQVARRLRRHARCANTVEVKIRFADFTTITRARSLPQPSDVTAYLWRTAEQLLLTGLTEKRAFVRLLGMGVSGLDSGTHAQLALFGDAVQDKQAKLDRIADQIKDRFGPKTIRRGVTHPTK